MNNIKSFAQLKRQDLFIEEVRSEPLFKVYSITLKNKQGKSLKIKRMYFDQTHLGRIKTLSYLTENDELFHFWAKDGRYDKFECINTASVDDDQETLTLAPKNSKAKAFTILDNGANGQNAQKLAVFALAPNEISTTLNDDQEYTSTLPKNYKINVFTTLNDDQKHPFTFLVPEKINAFNFIKDFNKAFIILKNGLPICGIQTKGEIKKIISYCDADSKFYFILPKNGEACYFITFSLTTHLRTSISTPSKEKIVDIFLVKNNLILISDTGSVFEYKARASLHYPELITADKIKIKNAVEKASTYCNSSMIFLMKKSCKILHYKLSNPKMSDFFDRNKNKNILVFDSDLNYSINWKESPIKSNELLKETALENENSACNNNQQQPPQKKMDSAAAPTKR